MLPYLHAKPRSGLNCGLLPWSFTVSSCFRFVSIVGVVVYFVQKMVIGFCQALSMEGRKVVCRVETSPFAKCAMKTGTALVFAASLCVPLSFFPILPSTAAAKTVIQGHARIVDGDTVRIGDNRIRLLGIDAPETKQTCTDQKGLDYLCGATSTEKLKAFMGEDSILRCESEKKDRYVRKTNKYTLNMTSSFEGKKKANSLNPNITAYICMI